MTATFFEDGDRVQVRNSDGAEWLYGTVVLEGYIPWIVTDGSCFRSHFNQVKTVPNIEKKIQFNSKTLGLRLAGNHVIHVSNNTQAKKHGIQVGWIITKINDISQPNDTQTVWQAINRTKMKNLTTTISFRTPTLRRISIANMTKENIHYWLTLNEFSENATTLYELGVNGTCINDMSNDTWNRDFQKILTILRTEGFIPHQYLYNQTEEADDNLNLTVRINLCGEVSWARFKEDRVRQIINCTISQKEKCFPSISPSQRRTYPPVNTLPISRLPSISPSQHSTSPQLRTLISKRPSMSSNTKWVFFLIVLGLLLLIGVILLVRRLIQTSKLQRQGTQRINQFDRIQKVEDELEKVQSVEEIKEEEKKNMGMIKIKNDYGVDIWVQGDIPDVLPKTRTRVK